MKIREVLIVLLGFLLSFILLFLYINKDFVYGKLDEWNLIYKPESFTELYFTDHLNLPTIVRENIPQEIEFTIVNEENTLMRYDWEVYAEDEVTKERIPLANGRELLDKRDSRNINVRYELPKVYERQRIVINLRGLDQQIYFWVIGEKV